MAVATPPVERQASRRRLAKQGKALPGGSYPIPNVAYLKKAIRAVGRAGPGKRPALARLIRKRGRELGAMNVVKGSWADNTQGAKAMANALRVALELAGQAGGPYGTMSPAPSVNDYTQQVTKLTGVGARVYRKLRSNGMPHHQALPLAKRAQKRVKQRGRSPGENVGTISKSGFTGYGPTTGKAAPRGGTGGLDRPYTAPAKQKANPRANPNPRSGSGDLPKSGSTGLGGPTTGKRSARPGRD